MAGQNFLENLFFNNLLLLDYKYACHSFSLSCEALIFLKKGSFQQCTSISILIDWHCFFQFKIFSSWNPWMLSATFSVEQPNWLSRFDMAEQRSNRYFLVSGFVFSEISSLALTLRLQCLLWVSVKTNQRFFPAQTSKPSFLSCCPAILWLMFCEQSCNSLDTRLVITKSQIGTVPSRSFLRYCLTTFSESGIFSILFLFEFLVLLQLF